MILAWVQAHVQHYSLALILLVADELKLNLKLAWPQPHKK